jgi:hypothetical protein
MTGVLRQLFPIISMKHHYRLLLALLALAGTAAAQAPAVATLHAVQTIALGPNATLGGTIRLPNHNTVLLLTDTERATMQAQCLSPEGRTLWETTVARYQHPRMEGVLGNTISSTDKMADDQVRYATTTTPVSVFTEGNNVVVVERISASAVKKLPKDTPFEAGQVYVQRLSEQGRLSRSSFAPLPRPKVDDSELPKTVGRYADARGFVEIIREDAYPKKNVRTQTFSLLHYDFGATEVRREPLALAPTPWLTGSWDMFRLWYQDWAYLGHRPNQTYFCRRLLVNSEKEKAGNQPLVYQVCVVDDQGHAAPGGFSTTLGLQKGTIPIYSGAIPNYGELDYAVQRFTSVSNVTGAVSYDSWETTAVGSFYLDHATGDVLLYGEYGEGDLPSYELRPELLGFFEQRYTFDGKPLARLQMPYTKDLTAHKKAGSFTGQYGRRISFHLDPLTGQSQYSFSPMHVLGTGEDFDLFLDPQLHLQRVEFVPGAQKSDNVYTTVYYAMPFNLFKASGSSTETRRYAHAHATDPPVYAALEQRSRAAGLQPFHEFHLSVTGPGTGLVIERNLGTGGTLQVFTF